MNQYSPQELDAKIHTFMKKKMHRFPELKDRFHSIDEEHKELRDRFKARHLEMFPIVRLGSLH